MRKEKVDLSNQLEEERRYMCLPLTSAEPSEKGEGGKRGAGCDDSIGLSVILVLRS